jgi:ribosome-associated toxin RatA of RatAB toxin-antitoxin module
MRAIRLRAAFAAEPAAAFPPIADFTRYPSLADDVREVRTAAASTVEGKRESHWVMNFRRGLMRWTELEVVDHGRLRIEFEQTDGDFEDFRGSWQLYPADPGTEVLFEVSYDFGIESLAGIMDPIAERVIKRAVCSVLSGLFGEIRVLEGAEALTDLAGPLPAAQTR